MTQENKELLLKDLCARLPYGVMCDIGLEDPVQLQRIFVDRLDGILLDFYEDGKNYQVYLSEVKPYLFPLESMTDKLWDKEFMGYNITEFTRDSFKYGCETLEFYDYNPNPDLSSMVGFINQLIKNHFDIYGLIPKGLAIDATNLNIY